MDLSRLSLRYPIQAGRPRAALSGPLGPGYIIRFPRHERRHRTVPLSRIAVSMPLGTSQRDHFPFLPAFVGQEDAFQPPLLYAFRHKAANHVARVHESHEEGVVGDG